MQKWNDEMNEKKKDAKKKDVKEKKEDEDSIILLRIN